MIKMGPCWKYAAKLFLSIKKSTYCRRWLSWYCGAPNTKQYSLRFAQNRLVRCKSIFILCECVLLWAPIALPSVNLISFHCSPATGSQVYSTFYCCHSYKTSDLTCLVSLFQSQIRSFLVKLEYELVTRKGLIKTRYTDVLTIFDIQHFYIIVRSAS